MNAVRIAAPAVALFLGACGGGGGASPPAAPSPVAVRTGVPPYYFGTIDATVDEIAQETGTIWSNGWGNKQYADVVVDQVQRAQQRGATSAIVSVDTIFTEDGDGVAATRATLDALRAAGTLSMVRTLFVCDECEQKGFTDQDMRDAASRVRVIAADYPELAGAKLMVNYGCGNAFVGWQAFDVIACDRYDYSAAYARATLREKAPGKEYMLIGGGVEPYLQDPVLYYNEVQADTAIIGFVSFIRHDFADKGLGLGIAHNKLAGAYCMVNRALATSRPLTSC